MPLKSQVGLFSTTRFVLLSCTIALTVSIYRYFEECTITVGYAIMCAYISASTGLLASYALYLHSRMIANTVVDIHASHVIVA